MGLTKTTFKKVLGRTFTSLSTLQTIVVEIEALLNDHPLTYISTDLRAAMSISVAVWMKDHSTTTPTC